VLFGRHNDAGTALRRGGKRASPVRPEDALMTLRPGQKLGEGAANIPKGVMHAK